MTHARDSELVQRSVLSDCSEALLIAELERRGWARGWMNVADMAFDMLWREQDTSALPFEMEFVPDFDRKKVQSA